MFSYLNIPRSLSKTAHPLLKLPAHPNTMIRMSTSTSESSIQSSRNCIHHRLIAVNIMKGEIPPPPPDTSSQALTQTGEDAVERFINIYTDPTQPENLKGLGVPYPVVKRLETMDSRTGLFDQSLVETVLASLVFMGSNPTDQVEWLCFEFVLHSFNQFHWPHSNLRHSPIKYWYIKTSKLSIN